MRIIAVQEKAYRELSIPLVLEALKDLRVNPDDAGAIDHADAILLATETATLEELGYADTVDGVYEWQLIDAMDGRR